MKIKLFIFALFISAFSLSGCSESEEQLTENTPAVTEQTETPASITVEEPQIEQAAPAGPQHRPYNGDPTGLAEIKLIDAQDDPRGWCVDLFAHRLNAQPVGGMQGHNCFMYFDIGSPTEDQGFDIPRFEQTGQLALPYFDVCMTLYDARPASFVASDPCSEDQSQIFTMSENGLIQHELAPELCLTLGSTSVPGGGRLRPPNSGRPPANNDSIHTIRRLTFDTCSAELAALQQWEFRFNEYIPDKTAEPHRFMYGKQ